MTLEQGVLGLRPIDWQSYMATVQVQFNILQKQNLVFCEAKMSLEVLCSRGFVYLLSSFLLLKT